MFLLPTLLIGTPLIEFRTMQLLALCVALPYLACATSQPAGQQLAPRAGWFGLRPPLQIASAAKAWR